MLGEDIPQSAVQFSYTIQRSQMNPENQHKPLLHYCPHSNMKTGLLGVM